jgi:outer membrane protein assembly factor BamB
VIVVLLYLVTTIPGRVAPGSDLHALTVFWGPIVGLSAVTLWWLFASRIRWTERGLGILAFAATGVAAWFCFHPSVRHPLVLLVFVLPMVTTAGVLWLLATPFFRWPMRRAGLLVAFLLVWGYFSLFRFEGIYGNASPTFQYRWTPTSEEKLLADIAARKLEDAPGSVAPGDSMTLHPDDWPGFRGPNRDGICKRGRIATDWQEHPPREVWRRSIGPGWSSFAVVGNRLYTQEQRGADELVVCYDANSGAQLWKHTDATRFDELAAGAGPRATPTFHDGKIYALGASGQLNCLDAATGEVKWSHNIAEDAGAEVPRWGFCSSPLISKGMVTVFAGGPEQKSVLGYNADTGKLTWWGGEGTISYCSLHPARLDGDEQVILSSDVGLTAFEPAEGKVLWQHSWPLDKQKARAVQPTLLGDSDVLIGTGFSVGTRRVHVVREGKKWSADEVWTTRDVKPYYNDVVVHWGHLYGFDADILTCVDLEDGKGKWRARGYGNGQVLLLPDQDLLLVLSEKGEVALVDASPDGHNVRGKFQAIKGRTWNHPVIANGKLYVRNGEEAVCYQLTDSEK